MAATRNPILATGLVTVLMSCISFVHAAGAAPQDAVHEIDITVGRSHVINAEHRISKVIVVDPAVADLEVVGSRRIVLFGRKLGFTDVILHFEDDSSATYQLDVTIDSVSLQSRLDSLFGRGITVDQNDGVLVLAGTVDNVDEAVQLESFMEARDYEYVDMTRIPGIQQVLLKVRIAEVSRDALRTLGFSAVVGGSSAFGGFQPGADPGGSFNPVGITPQANGQISPSNYVYQENTNLVTNAATLFGGIPAADLALYIKALTQNNYFRLLAEPNLVAISGEEASFLVGGEFPVPVIQGTSVGVGSSLSVEYKEVGVRLTFRPEVLGGNRIRLAVAPEVSEISETFGGVSFQGTNVPGILVRRSNTTVELNSGQTFAMAGLLQSKTEAQTAAVPLLGELPIIGALFRSVRYRDKQTELVVLVTAELVEPVDALSGSEVLPGDFHVRPNDWQLFMEGKIEGSVIAPLPDEQANALRKLGIANLEGPGAWKRFDDPSVPARPDYRVDYAIEDDELVLTPNESQTDENDATEHEADGGAVE
jgi:pilus assembly protein CpaC